MLTPRDMISAAQHSLAHLGERRKRWITPRAPVGLVFLIGNLCAAQEIPRTEVYLRYSFVRAKSAISVPAFTANHVQLIERFALSAVLGCYVILLTGASQYFQKLCQLLQRYTFPGKLEPAC